ncbi:uncharacterized protein [Euphorbia lathyris]|uniref:uncharacterized protein isoform X2 n=1 Tax=Euphorbia lathyris TaxID=212925 RepID=UPI0033140F91
MNEPNSSLPTPKMYDEDSQTTEITDFQIATYVCRFPLNYLVEPEKLKGIVQRVDEMGVDRKAKMFIEGVRVMSSMTRENWELKLKLFRDLGFSEQNILYAFRVYPGAFTVSERKIKECGEEVKAQIKSAQGPSERFICGG